MVSVPPLDGMPIGVNTLPGGYKSFVLTSPVVGVLTTVWLMSFFATNGGLTTLIVSTTSSQLTGVNLSHNL